MASWILPNYCLVVLAVILAVSGVGKLTFSPRERARHVYAMGFPETRFIKVAALTHPYTELVLAGVLVGADGWLRVAAVAIATLLCGFYLYVIIRQLQGNQPGACPCFGPPRPVTVLTSWRNVLLLSLAALGWFSIAMSSPSALRGIIESWQVFAVGCIVAAVVALSVRTPPQVDPDSIDYIRFPIPELQVWQQEIGSTTLPFLAQRGPVLLIIADHRGMVGGHTVKRIPQWRKQLTTVAVYAAVPAADHQWAEESNPEVWHNGFINDSFGQIYNFFHVDPNIPQAVLLGTDRLMAGGPVYGEAEINQFVIDISAQLTED